MDTIEPLLLAVTHVSTFKGKAPLTNASGFFFERGPRLYLVTSRHVMIDQPSGHLPDRIEIELHSNPANLAESESIALPLYENAISMWRQGTDSGGGIDVAVLEIDRSIMPEDAIYRAFTPESIYSPPARVDVGTSLLIVGFPLGFHDTLHHMPVVRHAVLASSFGLRFQGKGYFLTDARTHRGSSGAPVVMRLESEEIPDLPWALLGVHSASFDMGTRDLQLDEALGLNAAWYADILMTLTEEIE